MGVAKAHMFFLAYIQNTLLFEPEQLIKATELLRTCSSYIQMIWRETGRLYEFPGEARLPRGSFSVSVEPCLNMNQLWENFNLKGKTSLISAQRKVNTSGGCAGYSNYIPVNN